MALVRLPMSPDVLDQAAAQVLGAFHLASQAGSLTALGNRGGFSGARLWRVAVPAGDLCLRAWPPHEPARERLRTIHDLMGKARASGLDFVPVLCAIPGGATWTEHAGLLWELTTWMPGCADFHARPTVLRLQNACAGLAKLHAAWATETVRPNVCPGLRRRLDRVGEWVALVKSSWRPTFTADDPLGTCTKRAWQLVSRHMPDVPQTLAPWANRAMALQPCLADVWHDHILFEGDRLTGIVDFGGVKTDHVAVDLGRLLGSLVGDDARMWDAGLQTYRNVRPLTAEEGSLAVALDRTGVVIGAANWLRWLYRDGYAFEDPTAVAKRLRELVDRMEAWKSVEFRP